MKFQPTRPLRGATRTSAETMTMQEISTHAPLAGRDGFYAITIDAETYISTHAPLAGRDGFKSLQTTE